MGYIAFSDQTGNDLMAEHKHGEMDTKVQEETFEGFVNWTTRMVIVIFVVLIALAVFWS